MFHSKEEFEEAKARNQEREKQIRSDHAKEITRHDDLMQKIKSELENIESELDELQGIENQFDSGKKEIAQVYHAAVKYETVNNIPTIKAHVIQARKSIIE